MGAPSSRQEPATDPLRAADFAFVWVLLRRSNLSIRLAAQIWCRRGSDLRVSVVVAVGGMRCRNPNSKIRSPLC